MKAIILAAGSGSRMAPIGLTTPKLLMPILNKTILEHDIEAMSGLVDEVIVIISPNQFGQIIEKYIAAHTWPMPIITAVQQEPLGTANAFQAAQPKINGEDKLLCLLGDDLYSPTDIKNLASHDFAILGHPVADPEKWGILQPDSQGYLSSIIEKPTEDVGKIANTGAALVSTRIFSLYNQIKPSPRGEYEFPDSLTLFSKSHPLKIVEVQDYWLPIGYPWHILQAHQELGSRIKGNIDPNDYPGVKIVGEVKIGKNVQIGEDVVLKNVIIGDNVIIESHNTIVDYAVIGNNVTVKTGTPIQASTIFEGCRFEGGYGGVFHSVVGRNVQIGHHSTCTSGAEEPDETVKTEVKGQMIDTGLYNFGATIGDNVTIGNNVTTLKGVKIWPDTTIDDSSVIEEDVK